MPYVGEKFFEEDKIDLKKKKYIAFKGGGGKGNAYLGVIKFLESEKMNYTLPLRPEKDQITGVSGASAGAITALTVALGLNSKDIENISSKKTSKFLFEDGFEFEHFMTKDEPNPGVYRAVEIFNHTLGYDVNIGFTHDTIYEDDAMDKNTRLKLKREKQVFENQKSILGDIEKFIQDNADDFDETNPQHSLEKKMMKKIAKFRLDVAGGKLGQFSLEPIQDKNLSRLNNIFFVNLISSGLFKFLKKKLAEKIETGTASPIEKTLNSKTDFWKYIYNLIYDRGLFCGTFVRTYFERLIDYYLREYHGNKFDTVSEKYSMGGGTINFLDFYDVTGIDLRVGATNMTAGENVIFSRIHTPFFPVSEAVGISMNIPGVFKPVYIKNKDEFGNEFDHELSNLKSGLYVDSGLTNNMPLATFQETDGASASQILGFRVIEGPNPKTYNQNAQYIFDNDSMYPLENRIHYVKYLIDYLAVHNVLPKRIYPISSGFIPPINRGILGTTLFATLGQVLEAVLNTATLNDIDSSIEQNLVDIYSYNITTLDFTPNAHLLKFVTNQAWIRADGMLKFGSILKN
jgi:predicted acylesterase/phospholipase RssA